MTKNKKALLSIGIIFFITVIIFFMPFAFAQSEHKSILILHSYDPDYVWTANVQQGIESAFEKTEYDIQVDYMDTYRLDNAEYLAKLKEVLLYKYSSSTFDIIICSDNNALNFLLDNHEDLFPKTPVVFCGINNIAQDALKGHELFTGVFEQFSARETFELVLKLQPDLQKVYFYGMTNVTYEAIKEAFISDIAGLRDDLEIVFLENISLNEMIAETVNEQDTSCLFLLSLFIDDKGDIISSKELKNNYLDRINIPIYSCWDIFLNYGIIGGKLTSGFAQGEVAAKMAKRILAGENVQAIPVLHESPNKYIFDLNQMDKFHIKKELLPSESTFINEKHYTYSIGRPIAWGILALLSLMTFFIGVLLKNIFGRVKAEQELDVAKEELLVNSQELQAAYDELVITENYLKEQYELLRESEEALRTREEQYRLALEGAFDGIWDWDLKKDYLFFSERGKEILACKEEGMLNFTKFFGLVHHDDVDEVKNSFYKHLAGEMPFFQQEFRVKTKEGKYKWVLTRGTAVEDYQGEPMRVAGSISDISMRKESEEKIHYLAYYDYLTDLPNRMLFYEKIAKLITKAQQNNSKFAIFFLDLDNFKQINDSLGHFWGDRVLQKVSYLLRNLVDSEDIIARSGGDEFLLVRHEITVAKDVEEYAERILHVFKKPIKIEKKEFFVTPSIGITIYPYHGEDGPTLLKNADTAIYGAKELGKNTYQIFDQSMNTKILERIELEGFLRKAIELNEFVLYYQPQIDIKTGRIVRAEALVRWQHPIKGLLSPLNFIPLAEETGLIVSLGEWVLRTACKQNQEWIKAGFADLVIAVNLSAAQMQDRNLLSMIEKNLKETGLNPSSLDLEITESSAVQDIDFATNILNRLKKLGVKISLDDFGTGYSSMNYLKILPIDNLKIDKSFIRDITTSREEEEIAKTVIKLAHVMGLTVTAEGVEDEKQLEILAKHKCDLVQGYYFSKPVPAEEFVKLLQNQ